MALRTAMNYDFSKVTN